MQKANMKIASMATVYETFVYIEFMGWADGYSILELKMISKIGKPPSEFIKAIPQSQIAKVFANTK